LCWPGSKTREKELFEDLTAVTACMFNHLNYDTVGINVSEGHTVGINVSEGHTVGINVSEEHTVGINVSEGHTVSCFWLEQKK
jgi:hypothetical protein